MERNTQNNFFNQNKSIQNAILLSFVTKIAQQKK